MGGTDAPLLGSPKTPGCATSLLVLCVLTEATALMYSGAPPVQCLPLIAPRANDV